MYVDVPGFSEAFFGEVAGLHPAAQAVLDKCKEGDDSLLQKSVWRGWPDEAKESDVLNWLAQLMPQRSNFAEEHKLVSGPRRRPLAQPYQPTKGSSAHRKLNIGFVDDPSACRHSRSIGLSTIYRLILLAPVFHTEMDAVVMGGSAASNRMTAVTEPQPPQHQHTALSLNST